MIENTSNRDSLLNLIGLTNGLRYDDSHAYITGMEAAGQAQLVEGDEMPVNGPWEELEALGFVRREPIPGDPLFINAILPLGWKKEPTGHSMHTRVVDERGVERVRIFYKAAFYDRRADCHLVNVGAALAFSAVWGDGPVSLPDSWGLLTDTEKQDYVTALANELAENIEAQAYTSGESRTRRAVQAGRIRALQVLLAALAQSATAAADEQEVIVDAESR